MISIRAISSFIPSSSIDNLEQALTFEVTESFVFGKIGALRLPVADERDLASDLAYQAVHALHVNHGLVLDEIEALAVVTQNPDLGGLPHCSAVLHGKLGLQAGVACFDIGLGCSGYVYGLSILRGLMIEANLSNGVLCTSDQYSRIIDRSDRNTSLLFGDAATATWLSRDGCFDFSSPILETLGSEREALCLSEGKLAMNGRKVFDFAAIKVPAQINSLLEREEIDSCDIDLYFMHQGSAAIVNAIARRFPGIKERFLLDIERTGNTVSSSIPLLLEKYLFSIATNTAIISGFGVGLSSATNLLRRI